MNNISNIIETQGLKEAACAVAENCYHHPEINRLVPLMEWIKDHLDGIPFASEWDPYKHGDSKPDEATNDFFYLIDLIEKYHSNGTIKAKEIKENFSDTDITPSQFLELLIENWDFYTNPDMFHSMNEYIVFCINCAETFPDNPEDRKVFKVISENIFLKSNTKK